jgi:hypothetical protein
MVDHPPIRTGIDIIGDKYLAAQVEYGEKNVRVLALTEICRGELNPSLLSESGPLVCSFPDEKIWVKNVSVPSHYNSGLEKIVQFELENSVLDKPSEYCPDLVENGQRLQTLIVVTRRTALEQQRSELFEIEKNLHELNGLTARSIALGQGFIHFCSNDSERMVCLADFSTRTVSLSFILGNQIIALGSFDRSNFELDSESELSRMSLELKTIFNFKLSELSGRAINVGLSRLILTGGKLNQSQRELIAHKLGVELEEPSMNRVLSDKPVLDSAVPISSFLVALGLTSE